MGKIDNLYAQTIDTVLKLHREMEMSAEIDNGSFWRVPPALFCL
jgi:hypothetical protein